MLTISNPQSAQLMQCLASNNEVGLIVFEKNLKLSNAIDGTKIKKLEKTIGEINAIKAICYLLNRFNSNFNFGKSLTQQQSALLASDIVEKYPYETIEDVVLMLKQVRQGIIGDGKDYKLDGQTILNKWFPEYMEKKYIELERIKKAEYSITPMEKEIRANAVEKFYEKRRKQQKEKQKAQEMENEIDEMVKYMDRQMLEDTISDWEKKPEMAPHIDYLKRKRREVNGKYS